jgi:hypothetical protein
MSRRNAFVERLTKASSLQVPPSCGGALDQVLTWDGALLNLD